MFHKHKWIEVGRKFTPPSLEEVTDVRGHAAIEMVKDGIYGFTIVEQKCECGKRDFQKVQGDARNIVEKKEEPVSDDPLRRRRELRYRDDRNIGVYNYAPEER